MGPIHLYLTTILGIWITCVSMESVSKRYTYFANKDATWNSAFEFCIKKGMRLVTPISDDDNEAIRQFAATNDWDASLNAGRGTSHIWTGLHTPTGLVEKLVNGRCDRVPSINDTWLETTHISTSKCFWAEIVKDRHLKAEGCDKNHDVVCEKDIGSCIFGQRINVALINIPFISFYEVNIDDCQEICLKGSNNQQKCWAYSYNSSTGLCTNYQPSMFSLLDSALMPAIDTYLYVKTCYFSEFDDTTVIPLSKENKNKEPVSNCTLFPSSGTTPMTTPIQTSDVTLVPTIDTALSYVTSEHTSEITSVHTSDLTSEHTSVIASTTSTGNKDTTSKAKQILPETTHIEVSTKPNQQTTTLDSMIASSPNSEFSKTLMTTASSEKTKTAFVSLGTAETTTPISSTSVFTTKEAVNTDPCDCKCQSPNITQAEKDDFIEHLLGEIELNTANVSSTRRKYNSATDERVTSTSIGFVGGALICIPVVLIIVLDISTIKAHFIGK